jgi:hypothetical protein
MTKVIGCSSFKLIADSCQLTAISRFATKKPLTGGARGVHGAAFALIYQPVNDSRWFRLPELAPSR